jgi:uncharacterized protein (UPF0276 family)
MRVAVPDRFGILHDFSFSTELAVRPSAVDFVEIIPDRFFSIRDVELIPKFWDKVPIVFHSLNFSLGSTEDLDLMYLKRIHSLAEHFRPIWASDHLAVTRTGAMALGHLSPFRLTRAALHRVGEKISRIQATLGVQFLVENIACHFKLPGSDMSEGEFLRKLVETTGCGVLLDLNNVVVNAKNHGFDPMEYIRTLPLVAVRELHVAGHREIDGVYVDSHGEPVRDDVWTILRNVSAELGPINLILERDQNVPSLDELISELALAKHNVELGRAPSAEKIDGARSQ